jgi:HSP20 family protein
MTKQRDPFANFERVRREMDELFGDIWSRAGLRLRQAFRPRVDVYYSADSSVVVVKVELAGVEVGGVNLEVRGRSVVINGERRPRDSEGRTYQQIEIEYGPFHREIELRLDVDGERARATYEEGMLRVELPVLKRPTKTRQVPISDSAAGPGEDGGEET